MELPGYHLIEQVYIYNVYLKNTGHKIISCYVQALVVE